MEGAGPVEIYHFHGKDIFKNMASEPTNRTRTLNTRRKPILGAERGKELTLGWEE